MELFLKINGFGLDLKIMFTYTTPSPALELPQGFLLADRLHVAPPHPLSFSSTITIASGSGFGLSILSNTQFGLAT